MKNNHLFQQNFVVTKHRRFTRLKQNPTLIWLTGLSGSGKSTIANALEIELFQQGFQTYSLDGDNLRLGLCKDLGFSNEDRNENIRRIAEVAKLMLDSGLVVLGSFISPTQNQRDMVRQIVGSDNFIDIYVSTPLEECESRDPKGLYKKARAGIIKNFTGVSSSYEKPQNARVTIDTSKTSIKDAIDLILKQIKNDLHV